MGLGIPSTSVGVIFVAMFRRHLAEIWWAGLRYASLVVDLSSGREASALSKLDAIVEAFTSFSELGFSLSQFWVLLTVPFFGHSVASRMTHSLCSLCHFSYFHLFFQCRSALAQSPWSLTLEVIGQQLVASSCVTWTDTPPTPTTTTTTTPNPPQAAVLLRWRAPDPAHRQSGGLSSCAPATCTHSANCAADRRDSPGAVLGPGLTCPLLCNAQSSDVKVVDIPVVTRRRSSWSGRFRKPRRFSSCSSLTRCSTSF